MSIWLLTYSSKMSHIKCCHSFPSCTVWLDSFLPPACQSMKLRIISFISFWIQLYDGVGLPLYLFWNAICDSLNDTGCHCMWKRNTHSLTECFFPSREWNAHWLPHSVGWNIPIMGRIVHWSSGGDGLQLYKNCSLHQQHLIVIVP
jgi:hypothetical protein